MGRRKKEPPSAHRSAISTAAQHLFMEKGIEAVSMDDIAKAAGYSKATLYVYFKNKEEIVGVLVLESMRRLQEYMKAAAESRGTARDRYDRICFALAKYQEEYPFYFNMALDRINIDFDSETCLSEDKETFRIGEEINEMIFRFLKEGIAENQIRSDLVFAPTVFSFWGMLSGLVQIAVNKEAYIARELKLSKQEFLEYGFDMLYRSVVYDRQDNKLLK